MSDIYLSLTETPSVVTLSQPVISGALSSTVTVANTVTVALDANSLSALENVTVTVGAAVSVSNFPSTQTIAGTVTANANLFTTVTVQTITGGQNGGGILFFNNVGLYDVTFDAPGEYTIQSGFISGGFVATGVTLPLTTAFGTPVTGSFHSGSLFRRQVPYSNLNTAFRITAVTTAMTPASFTATVRAISDPYYGLNRPISGTVTVGNTVTIGSLPAISGTVTARLQDASGNNLTSTSIGGVQRLNVSLASAATPGGSIPSFVNVYGGSDSGTVRAVAVDSSGKSVVTVSNFPSSTTVTVSNFPATQQVSGTVTANTGLSQPLTDTQLRASSVPVSGPLTDTQLRATAVPVSGTFWQATQPVSIASVTIGNSITIGSFSTSVTARLINPAGTAVTYAEIGTAGNPSIDVLSIQGVTSGTAVPVSISSVTIGAVPNGALTTRFGSVTTANTAQISSAVTNASRKYLFIQNVTTSSNVITIGIGFTPTTTQGIQLSAGGGITFESSYIPTGAVYILSSVTASPFTILEA